MRRIFAHFMGIILALTVILENSVNVRALEYIDINGTVSSDLILDNVEQHYRISLNVSPGVTVSISEGVTISGSIELNDNARLIIGSDEGKPAILNNVAINHSETYSPYGDAAYGLGYLDISNTILNDGSIRMRNADVQIADSYFYDTSLSLNPSDIVEIDISENLFIDESDIQILSQDKSLINISNNTFSNDNVSDISINTATYGDASLTKINGNNFLNLNKEWIINAFSDKNVSTIDATNNYWRTTNNFEIERLIYDHADSYRNKINVNYSAPLSSFNNLAPLYEEQLPLIVKPGKAENDISGYIEGELRLTIDRSPYIVSSYLDILPGASLIVDPGVEILGMVSDNSSSSINIDENATIQMNGTVENLIYLKDVNIVRSYVPNQFNKIVPNFVSLSRVNLDNSKIMIQKTYLKILNSRFHNSSNIYVTTSSEEDIPSQDHSVSIVGSIFENDSNISIYMNENASIEILSNSFNNRKIYDISLSRGIDISSIIPIKINDNNFLNLDKDFVIVTENKFSDTFDEIDATNNYWRTTDQDVIESYVYDHYQDYGNRSIVDTSKALDSLSTLAPIIAYENDLILKPRKEDNVLSGWITSDTTILANDGGYKLSGYLDVLPGVTLTINEGVNLDCFQSLGDTSCSDNAIVIHSGAKLNVLGSLENPVVFNGIKLEANNSTIEENLPISINYLKANNSTLNFRENLAEVKNSVFTTEDILKPESSSYGYSYISFINPVLGSKFYGNLLLGNVELSIVKYFGKESGIEVIDNTFNRNYFGITSANSTHDILVRATEGSDYSGIYINDNNFINLDKQHFLYLYSDSDDSINLQRNFWRNLSDLEINKKIYDKGENSSNLSNVNISSKLEDFNTEAPYYEYYFIDGFENNVSYTTNITVDHNYRKAWINGVLFASGLLVKDEGKYTVKFEKDDSTTLERVFYIDKTAPVISIGEYTTTPTNLDIVVNVSTNEGKLNTLSHTFSENGSFKFVATDDAGNVTEQLVMINNIDKTFPVITIGEYTTTPTNLDIVVNVSTNEGKLNTLSHTFSENGSFKFVATDDAGNATEQLVTINNIDKTAPKVYGIEDKVTYSSQRTIFFNEGTATLNGQAFTSGTSVSTAGKYVLVVEDKAGNVTKVNFEIANPNPTTPSTPTEQNPTTQTTIISPSSSAGANNQISQTSYVEKLNDLTEILSDESVSNLVFTNLLKDIFNLNPDFISELDEVEQKALEDKILEVYASTLDIRVEGNSELKLEGYSFIDDLAEILKGSKIEVLVQVSEEINSTDQSLIDSYVSKNNLDSTMLYSIDLELFKSINGVEEKLSTLKQPVTITLPLPSKFAGVTDFTIIHVHEGTIYELPVIINGDGTFSFTTDKFSSFTLIDAAKLVPVIEEVEQSKNELNWLWGGSLVILIALAAYFIRKRSKIVG